MWEGRLENTNGYFAGHQGQSRFESAKLYSNIGTLFLIVSVGLVLSSCAFLVEKGMAFIRFCKYCAATVKKLPMQIFSIMQFIATLKSGVFNLKLTIQHKHYLSTSYAK